MSGSTICGQPDAYWDGLPSPPATALQMSAAARNASTVRMIVVDAEIRQWSRRRALDFVPVGEQWLTTVL